MCYFILDADNNVVAVEVRKWMLWFEANDAKRVVAQTQCGTFLISTVFLGINSHPFGNRPPYVFETMVVANDGSIVDQNRWKTWKEAEDGHAAIARRFGGARS